MNISNLVPAVTEYLVSFEMLIINGAFSAVDVFFVLVYGRTSVLILVNL